MKPPASSSSSAESAESAALRKQLISYIPETPSPWRSPAIKKYPYFETDPHQQLLKENSAFGKEGRISLSSIE